MTSPTTNDLYEVFATAGSTEKRRVLRELGEERYAGRITRASTSVARLRRDWRLCAPPWAAMPTT